MEVSTKFTWERSPGEEIELEIGGEYTPAGQLTEFDQPHSDNASFDWFNDGHNTYPASAVNFQPHELDAAQNALLEVAREKFRPKAQFPGIRGLLGLPEKPFVI